ncbi:MAG: DUF1801 domain-containing protein [Gemmatimonadetes bacterium]|nr:DUF1801 domain-containing protein [Gemmatimonadota bacterium]MCC6771171.1 DUF1801 domain-containing protein [Gemmatimonadaceae bacterium]
MTPRPAKSPQVAPAIRAYLAALPPASRRALKELRAVIQAAAPAAEPAFSYRIPAYRYAGRMLVWCAGWKDHVSVYPITPAMKEAGGTELAKYVAGKGTLRFAIDTPLPTRLVQRLVRARVEEIGAA